MISIAQQWIVYRVWARSIDPARPFFIGACSVADFPNLADMATWTTPTQMIDRWDDATMHVTVIAIYPDKATAEQVQHATALIERVWVNLNDTRCDPPIKRGGAGRRTIVEPSTGNRWANASALAREIGKSAQAVSLHLRGKATHIAGRKFQYEDS